MINIQINNLEESIRRLCLIAPLDRPFIVRRRKMQNYYGSCGLVKGVFIITIASNVNKTVAIESLIHEWAHAMAWHEKKEHGPVWGVCYARLWSDLFD